MIKKTVKLMVAVSIATGFGMSAFMESAEAQRRTGNTYSTTSGDQQSVLTQFSLVDVTRDGKPIDEDEKTKEDDKVGFFRGAIENYTEGLGTLCIAGMETNTSSDIFAPCRNGTARGRYIFDSSGYPIFLGRSSFRPTPSKTPFDGDLKAELFQAGEDPLFEDNPTAIAYTILKPGEEETGSVLSPSYRLLNLAGLDINQAVNSLKYILENNLLDLATPVLTSRNSVFLVGDILVQNRFDQGVPVTAVPEPDTTIASLLGLGVLGAGSRLKRKVKQS